ncbi:MAG: phospholipase D-like domain-containing protein [Candidatus Omnitrophota bacterium]|nr:phospholipase D-like domain-containing protein [Candidatus Omnitrophota bacterium]
MKSNKLQLVIFFIILTLCLPVFAADQASEFYPAKVKDISDRAYEPAVIQLLDSAKESIIMSLYIFNPPETGPVRLLMKDLEEALSRGVSVEIYINTKPGHGMPSSEEIDRIFLPITEKGARIYKVTPYYLLHDKLIIVDGRYVVDGSTNWSIAALKSNYESAVLIDSPELAKTKLLRLRRFLLEGDKKDPKPRPDRPVPLESLPKDAIVSVSAKLLNNHDCFSTMLERMADRAMDMYLLLLAESSRLGENSFFISLEDIAISLGMDHQLKDADLRRQMIKVLETLQDRYKLLNANFSYGKDAWIELKEIPGATFKMTGDFFDPKNLVSKSQPAKFVLLVKALLEAEGKSIESASVPDLARRFGVSQFSLRKGLREIGQSAIE